MKQKKLLFLLLAWIMSATGAYATSVGDKFKVGDIEYTITKKDLTNPANDEVAVSYIGGSGAVTIPQTVKNDQDKETYKVTSSAVSTTCKEGVTSITFPEGYTTMGNSCYRNVKSLTQVNFPSTFTSLGLGCLQDCPAFTKYTVTSGNSTYQSDSNGWLLSADGKTVVSCPSGTQGDVTIPDGITTLEKNAFNVCRGIQRLHIPASVVNIDQTTSASISGTGSYIEVDGNNTAFKDVNGVLCTKDGKTLVSFPIHYDKQNLASDGMYTVPASVETIASEAFLQTDDVLKQVDLNNVKTLKEDAFNRPFGLSSVNIGKNVSTIESGAFINCVKLAKFTVDENNTTYKGKDDMVYSKDETKLILCPMAKTGEYTIPEGTVSVEKKAFYRTSLTKVTFPSTLTSVGEEAFHYGALTQLDFGNNSQLQTIAKSAFADTKLAGTLTIPASVTKMGDEVFYNTKLTSIHIADGSKLGYIEVSGFHGLPELESFVFDGTNSITRIGAKAFSDDPKLKSFDVPATVTAINENAFQNTPVLLLSTWTRIMPIIPLSTVCSATRTRKRSSPSLQERLTPSTP